MQVFIDFGDTFYNYLGSTWKISSKVEKEAITVKHKQKTVK